MAEPVWPKHAGPKPVWPQSADEAAARARTDAQARAERGRKAAQTALIATAGVLLPPIV